MSFPYGEVHSYSGARVVTVSRRSCQRRHFTYSSPQRSTSLFTPAHLRERRRILANDSQKKPEQAFPSQSRISSLYFFVFVFVVSFFFATFHCQAFEKQGGRRFSNARRVRCSFTSSSPLHAFAKEARREVGKQENKEMLRYERCQRGLFVDSAHRATTLPK